MFVTVDLLQVAALRTMLAEGGYGATEFKRKLVEERKRNEELQIEVEMMEAKAIMQRTEVKNSLSTSLKKEIDAKNTELKRMSEAYKQLKRESEAMTAKLATVTKEAEQVDDTLCTLAARAILSKV